MPVSFYVAETVSGKQRLNLTILRIRECIRARVDCHMAVDPGIWILKFYRKPGQVLIGVYKIVTDGRRVISPCGRNRSPQDSIFGIKGKDLVGILRGTDSQVIFPRLHNGFHLLLVCSPSRRATTNEKTEEDRGTAYGGFGHWYFRRLRNDLTKRHGTINRLAPQASTSDGYYMLRRSKKISFDGYSVAGAAGDTKDSVLAL